jgi:hypothetical protein
MTNKDYCHDLWIIKTLSENSLGQKQWIQDDTVDYSVPQSYPESENVDEDVIIEEVSFDITIEDQSSYTDDRHYHDASRDQTSDDSDSDSDSTSDSDFNSNAGHGKQHSQQSQGVLYQQDHGNPYQQDYSASYQQEYSTFYGQESSGGAYDHN